MYRVLYFIIYNFKYNIVLAIKIIYCIRNLASEKLVIKIHTTCEYEQIIVKRKTHKNQYT